MSDDKSEPTSTDPSESTSNDPSNVSSADSASQSTSKEGSDSKKDDKSKKKSWTKSFDKFLSDSADQKAKNSKGNPNETNPVRAQLEKFESLLTRILSLIFKYNVYVGKKIGVGLGSGYDGLKSGAKGSYKYLKDKASDMKNSTDKSTAAENADSSQSIDGDLPNDGSAIEMKSISSAAPKVDDSTDTQVKSSVESQTASDATSKDFTSSKESGDTPPISPTKVNGPLKRERSSVDPLNPVKLTSPTSSEGTPSVEPQTRSDATSSPPKESSTKDTPPISSVKLASPSPSERKPADELKTKKEEETVNGVKSLERRELSESEDPLANSSVDIKPS